MAQIPQNADFRKGSEKKQPYVGTAPSTFQLVYIF